MFNSLTQSNKLAYSVLPMDIRMRFRIRVLDYLEQRGMKQKMLVGDRPGNSSEGWISNIMTGKRGINLEDVELIAHALSIPPAELIREPTNNMMELTPDEIRLVQAFRLLSGHEQSAVITLATLRQRKARATGRPLGRAN